MSVLRGVHGRERKRKISFKCLNSPGWCCTGNEYTSRTENRPSNFSVAVREEQSANQVGVSDRGAQASRRGRRCSHLKGEVEEIPNPRCCFLNHFYSPGFHIYSISHMGNIVALFQNACYLLTKSVFNMDCCSHLGSDHLLDGMAHFWCRPGWTLRFTSMTSLKVTGRKAGHLFFVLERGPLRMSPGSLAGLAHGKRAGSLLAGFA